MTRRESARSKRSIESYEHRDKERLNNPPVGLVTPDTDPDAGPRTYAYDPHLDPQLHWAGKAEHTSFEVPTVSLHVHERIDPLTIVEAVRRQPDAATPVQLPLFQTPEENPPIRQAIEFYRHAHGWSNRLVAGDSLLVMNSLLEKEGLGGQAQMIYIDPPYGIKYGSNFQPFVNKRDVKDGKDEDLTAEPEQIRAFRDTWELGIHSYLSYLRDRLLLARELLHESGSIFVQISDENVHHVRELMDEVFGAANFIADIPFRKKTMPLGAKYLEQMYDFLLWYGRDKNLSKYHQLYYEQSVEGDFHWKWYELPDGSRQRMSTRQLKSHGLLPPEARVFRLVSMWPPTYDPNSVFDVQVFGRKWRPPKGACYPTNPEGMSRLVQANRLEVEGQYLRYVLHLDDYKLSKIVANWSDTIGARDQKYVVETSVEVVKRCILMTTDPGDLVFDPTCVRKGTRVYSPSPTLPANGEGANLLPPTDEANLPPFTGGLRGGLVPIESLRPGDRVLSHDGQPHRVLRLVRKAYHGQMIGLCHALSQQTLWLTADHLVLCKPRPRTLGGQRDWSASPISHLERRKQLRRAATPTERKLWSALRNDQLGVKFRRQHPIGPYIADFYSREAHLVVEVDGAGHFEPEQVQYDAQRDAYMRRLGLDVLRFTPNDVERNLPGVSLAIQNHVQIRLESPQEAQWIQAGALQPGDLVFCGPDLQAAKVQSIERAWTEETVYDLEIEGAHSFITDVCAVHNCGSGTTAYVAEQWGRRWITCDTSRVALTLARTRLMTAVYDYYELAHPQEGVGSGFEYKTVPHVTLKSIANNPDIHEGMTREEIDAAIARHAPQETLYDQPAVDRKKTRVSGPFTVEAVPAPAVRSVEELLEGAPQPADASIARSGETLRQAEWRDELLRTGLRGKAGQHIRFARLEPLPGCRALHADGETHPSAEGAASVREDAPAYTPLRAVVSFGPEHAPLEQRQVAAALEEAQTLVPRPKLLIFAAFQFDPEAARDVDETRWPGVTLLKAQMNADLLTDDLKKKRTSNESFWLIGQPDAQVERIAKGPDKGKLRVSVHGFDYYNTRTGNIESGGADQIAVWLLDTDYDGRSLLPRQVFFPLAGPKEGWARLARVLKSEIDLDLIEAYRGTVSLPFAPGEHRRIAVKIVDDRGIESLKVLEVE